MQNEEYARKIISGDIDNIDIGILNSIIMECKDLYYNSTDGTSYLSDAEYDYLENILKDLSDGTIEVGSPVRGGKIDLPSIMGSLDQNYDGDTENWINSLNLKNEDIVIGDKQDGVSGSAIYENGNLTISYSRGDGIQGADTTRHLKNMKNCIQSIPHAGIFDVRYEIIIRVEDFEKLVKQLQASNQKVPENARNYAAGQMNREIADDWFYDNARVIVTSINDSNHSMNKSNQYELCKKYGFEVTPYGIVKGSELDDAFLLGYLHSRKEATKTEIDGIVLDINDKEIRKNMKWKDNSINPPYSRKFKVNDSFAETTVISVEWRPSKTGYIKPRVMLEPVRLAGVTITFASGFNAKFIVDNKIGKGALVKITRAGDVIPHIVEVIKPGELLMPDCDYHWNETDVDIVLDDPNSTEVIVRKLTSTFSELKIPNLKQASIEKLVYAGYDSIDKIIKMTSFDLQSILGSASGIKVYDGLKQKLSSIKLSTLAGASNLLGRGIGVRILESIDKVLGDEWLLDQTITVNQLEKISGIGEKTAILIKKNMKSFILLLNEIEGYFQLEKPKTTGTELSGIKVCFTGIRDENLEEVIKSKGGEIVSKIKTGVILVCKDPSKNSGKMKDAKALLNPEDIITIEEARKKWGE